MCFRHFAISEKLCPAIRRVTLRDRRAQFVCHRSGASSAEYDDLKFGRWEHSFECVAKTGQLMVQFDSRLERQRPVA